MRRINFLGCFLLTSILMAFVLPLPINDIVNGNNNDKNLVSQNMSQNLSLNRSEIANFNNEQNLLNINKNYIIQSRRIGANAYEPVFTIKSGINQILPSGVTTKNYTTYLNVTNSASLVPNRLQFKPNDDDGGLIVTGLYYTTAVHSDAQTAIYSYNLTGFAIKSTKPSFLLKSSAINILASGISISNVEKYIEIKDPNSALIKNDIRFVPEDIDGILTINGTYYETTYHNSKSVKVSFSYSLKGFSINNGKENYKFIFIGIIGAACGIILLILLVLLLKYLINKSKGSKKIEHSPGNRNIRVNTVPESRKLDDRNKRNRISSKKMDPKRRY